MKVYPSRGDSQNQNESACQSRLPSKGKVGQKREPTAQPAALRISRCLFGERALDPRPQRRTVRIVAQLLRGNAQRLPVTNLFRANRASHCVCFQSSPFGGRAIFENPIAIVTDNIHHRSPCLRSTAA